jgi:hypothetical protein
MDLPRSGPGWHRHWCRWPKARRFSTKSEVNPTGQGSDLSFAQMALSGDASCCCATLATRCQCHPRPACSCFPSGSGSESGSGSIPTVIVVGPHARCSLVTRGSSASHKNDRPSRHTRSMYGTHPGFSWPNPILSFDSDTDTDPDPDYNPCRDRDPGGTGTGAGGRRPGGFPQKARSTPPDRGLTFHLHKWLFQEMPLVAAQHWQRVASATRDPPAPVSHRGRNRDRDRFRRLLWLVLTHGAASLPEFRQHRTKTIGPADIRGRCTVHIRVSRGQIPSCPSIPIPIPTPTPIIIPAAIGTRLS